MKRKTIRNHRDFFVSAGNLKSVTDYFLIKAKTAQKPGDARYGVVVSKRVFRTAVSRNRAKRLMRDWLAFNEHCMLPDLDYIFVLYLPILECNRDTGRKSVALSLKRITKTYKKQKRYNTSNNAEAKDAK
jgi:ribonuclease P protein component